MLLGFSNAMLSNKMRNIPGFRGRFFRGFDPRSGLGQNPFAQPIRWWESEALALIHASP